MGKQNFYEAGSLSYLVIYINAENLLNSYSYEELKLVFQKYGEERYSNSIDGNNKF